MFTTDDILVLMKEKILPSRLKSWEAQVPQLNSKTLEEFNDAAQAVILDVFAELGTATSDANIAGAECGEAEAVLYGELVAVLNSVIPPEHKFVLGMLKVNGKKGFDFISLIRTEHSVFHELVSQEIVPLVIAESATDLEEGTYVIEVFLPGDDRPTV